MDDNKNEPTDDCQSVNPKCLELFDNWSFDVFSLANETKNWPLKCVTKHVFNRYGILHNFKINPSTFENFICCIETGYKRFNNPYHNNIHAADVTQTLHVLLCKTGLASWLSDLEIFASLLAAIIHDYEHTGTTNNFHIMTSSEKALIYNDRSVQENHHISATFFILKDENCNILLNLSNNEYRQLRSIIIDMVLSTDMAFHFQLLKDIKSRLKPSNLKMDKSKALAFILHASDVSNPSKAWDTSSRWAALIMEEFFRQGDQEKELGLPISPLCDRYDTLVPESQINFMDFIVAPTFAVLSEMLDFIIEPKEQNTSLNENHNSDGEVRKNFMYEPWTEGIAENKRHWTEKTLKINPRISEKQSATF